MNERANSNKLEVVLVVFCLMGFSIAFALISEKSPLTVHIDSYRMAGTIAVSSMYLLVYLFYWIFRRDVLQRTLVCFLLATIAGMGAFIGILLYLDSASIFCLIANLSTSGQFALIWDYIRTHYILFISPLIILIVACIILYRMCQEMLGKKALGIFGTAEFANRAYLNGNDFYNSQFSLFGKDDRGEYLYHPICNRTIISMSGGGKTAGITIPALLTEDRPVFVHDPKGELWAVTAKHRVEKFGRKIILFDPFGITEQKSFRIGKSPDLLIRHSLNPLSYFPENNINFRDRFITSLTSSIVKTEGSLRHGTHFEDTAKILIGGTIDLLLSRGDSSFLNLYNIVAGGPETIKQNIFEYIKNKSLTFEAISPHLKEALAILETTGKEEIGSIFSTTLRQLRWLSDSNLRTLFQQDTCDLRDFVKGKADIFIVLPEDQIKEQGRVVRLILALTASLLIQTDRSELSSKQYLFLLDELGQLGYTEEIENYLEILRGRNCIFWSVFQTYSQIKQYQKPDLFINAKMLQLFSCSDPDIMNLIQKLGGTTSVIVETHSNGESRHNTGETTSKGKGAHEIGTDLTKFNDIRELPFDKQLVFIQGMRPIKCDKTLYFKEKQLMAISDPNPMETGRKY